MGEKTVSHSSFYNHYQLSRRLNPELWNLPLKYKSLAISSHPYLPFCFIMTPPITTIIPKATYRIQNVDFGTFLESRNDDIVMRPMKDILEQQVGCMDYCISSILTLPVDK